MKRANPKKAIDDSIHSAELLQTVGTLVEIQRDTGPSTFSWTTSKPWALGHGHMVVKVEGISGGFDCSRITPLESDKTEWLEVTFEDHGQDFSRWYIADGVTQWCEPSQSTVWGGVKVLNKEIKVGDRVRIVSRSVGILEISYPVQIVSTVKKADIVSRALISMRDGRKAVAA